MSRDFWNHKLLNELDRLPKREQAQAKLMFKRIPYAETRKESERLRNLFSRWCEERGHESASATLERGWGRMVTFYDYPKEHFNSAVHNANVGVLPDPPEHERSSFLRTSTSATDHVPTRLRRFTAHPPMSSLSTESG